MVEGFIIIPKNQNKAYLSGRLQMNMEGYRDIHGTKTAFPKCIKSIEGSSMSAKQKKQVLVFVRDLKIGKVGKKVKERRITNYLQFLHKLHSYFKKDLDSISENEATQFYLDLQEDKIKKESGLPYSQATKDEYVKTLKRFLGWAWNGRDSIKYRKCVKWMKEEYRRSEKRAITLDQAEKVIEKEKSVRNRCLFMFLFDSGARIEEALNVRLGDLTRDSASKFYIVHLRGTKTEESNRKISLPLAGKSIKRWLQEYSAGEPGSFLFPINYDNARKIIKQMSDRVLGFKIKPHELRHSSATYYVQRFGADNIGGFYYRFGWKFGSKEANTYIKTYLFAEESGQKKIVKEIEDGKIERLEEAIKELRQEINEYKKCKHLLLNLAGLIREERKKEKEIRNLRQIDVVLPKRVKQI
jgi:integrase